MNKITLGFSLAKSKITIKGLFVLFALLFMSTQVSWGQTYYNMSSGNYSQTFTNLSTAYPTNFNGLAILGTGSIPIATRTTTATNGTLAVVGSSTAIGYDAVTANSTRMIFLSTGSTDNSAAVACDLNLNFSGRNAGNLSFNYANIFNTSATVGRAASLIVFYSTDGTTWTTLGGPYTVYNTTGASTANVPVSITLPAALNNQSTVKFRFYQYNGGTVVGSPSGARPRIGLDDIVVTSTSIASAPVVSSASLIGTVGTSFTYNISATNSPTSYAIASGTLPDGLSLNTTTGVITGTPTTAGTVNVDVTATNGTGTSPAVVLSFNISPLLTQQTITFDALAPVTYGDAAFGLTATASSTLPVSYASSNTAVATVSGSTVTIVGAGSTNITASQAGNGSFNAAENVIQALTVNAKVLTLPDAAAVSRAFNTLFTTNITGTLTGIINADDVTLDGNLKGTFADANVANGIEVTSACTLAGTKTANYSLTQPTGLTANITQASQTIIFGALANRTVGAANFNPGATSPTSGVNPIVYTSSNTAVATIVLGQIQIVGAGTTNITASQAASLNYTAAIDVVQPLTVVAAPLVAWQFGSPAALGTEVTFNATTNNANLNTVVLSRGAGITTTALARGFSATTWAVNGTKSSAISDDEYYQFAVTVNPGYKLNITGLDATLRRTSTGPNAYIWTYSTDGNNFTEIGTDVSFTSTADGVLQTPIDLSGIPALQNIENITTLTFRLYAWGGTNNTATFAIGRYGASITTNSLAISGTVEAATSTTWNGSAWTSGAPNDSIDAIIAGPYSAAANITAKTLTVNNSAVATIPSGNNVTLTGAVTVIAPATLTFSNNANLIQDPATVSNTNNGNITVNRNSNALSRLDYTLWSSPVTGTQTLAAFSPLTSQIPSRFYTYNESTNVYTAITTPVSTTFAVAQGYLIRMPNTAVIAPATQIFTGTFTGVPNNGTVTRAITNLGSGFNAVGNPYPSTIDAQAFITANTTSIENSLYFWRKVNDATGSAYAVYNPMGGTIASPSSDTPNGIIQVGQGFFVKAKSGASSVNFTNAMRVANNANQFFRTNNAQKDRLWLNLTNTAGVFSQTLIGFTADASQGIDIFDAKYINDSPVALTSQINNEEYSIQGRPAFTVTDVVALNFKTDAAGEFNIALGNFDGLFTNNQNIFLVDSKTGAETNLKNGAYTFSATAGTDNTRFKLTFESTLSIDNPSFNDSSVFVYKNNGSLHVNAGTTEIKSVSIYDIQGRVISQLNNVNATNATITNLRPNQVLIVKIIGADNAQVSKKVVY